MPAVAVVGAVAAWSAVSTVGIITAIGATIGAVGAVTGNKTLSMVGGAMSLVGGITSMAGAASATEGVASTAGGITDSVAGATGAAAGEAAVSTAAGAAPQLSAPAAGVLDTSAAVMNPTVDAAGAVAGAADISSIAPNVENIAQYGGTTSSPYIDSSTLLPKGTNIAGSTVGQLTSGAAPTTGFLDKFLTFTQKNPTLIDTGMRLVGGAMQGEYNQQFVDLKQQELDMRKERQRWGNSQPDITGMIANSKKLGAK